MIYMKFHFFMEICDFETDHTIYVKNKVTYEETYTYAYVLNKVHEPSIDTKPIVIP